MEALNTIQEQNRNFYNTEEYDVFVEVYEKKEETEKHSLQFIVSEGFNDIHDANAYIKEQDTVNKHFEIKLEKDIQIDGFCRNVLNFQDLKASVDIILAGYNLKINTDAVICAKRLEGCRWKEGTNGLFVSAVSNIHISKGKTLHISAQETDRIEVSYVNFEAENSNMILGNLQKNTHINFYKVSFEHPLKKIDVYGSFYYTKPWKSDDRSLEVTDTLRIYNRIGEAAIYAPMKVNKLELDGNLSVMDLQSTGLFSVNNSSKLCILSGGRAEVNNLKVKDVTGEAKIPFSIIMEQLVSLGKYKEYSVEDWETVFQNKEKTILTAEEFFEDAKLLSKRGILKVGGKIIFTDNRTLPILLEKHYCWEAVRKDSTTKASFSYPVDFFKETSLERGETLAFLPKTAVSSFSVRDKNTCLKYEKERLKAVASAVIVLREGMRYKVEYTSLQEAADNLKSDFGIEKNENANFIFIFKNDHVLSGNVVFPKFVKKLQFVTELLQEQNASLVKRLDLNGYSISMSGFLNLNAGLEIISHRKAGTINLIGKQGETGLHIFVGGSYFLTPDKRYKNDIFYPLQNVNVLSASGLVVADGLIPGGIDGNISVYECVINSNIWKINEITAAKLFIGSARDEVLSEEVVYSYKEGRLDCNKINVTGKFVVEEMQNDKQAKDETAKEHENLFLIEEKVRCNTLISKSMEMHNGLVRVLKSAHITDLFLFYNNPTLQVEGNTFDIKGKVICGAENARLITVVREEKKAGKQSESVLQIDGEIKIIQDERYGIVGDRITVSVLSNNEMIDLRNHERIKNVLLKAKKASENVFQLDNCNGNAFDIQQIENDSYVLKKTGDRVEVISGDEVTVALYKKELENHLINYYKDINDAMDVINTFKEKESDYVIQLIRDIGKEEEKAAFKLPKYANNITFVSKEYNTIYCSKPLVQNTNVILKNVRLESDSDYVAGKYKLELENSGLEVADLKVKDFRMVHSDIVILGNAELGNLFLMKTPEGMNTNVVTAYRTLQLNNIIGEGELTLYNTYTAKTWKKAVSQMKMKGEISDRVSLDLRPCFYNTEENVYTSFLKEDGMFDEETFGGQSEEYMVTGNEIPAAFKRAFTAKNLSYINPVFYYGMSHEKVWPMKYKDGIYFTNVPNVIFVDILTLNGRERVGEFRGWEDAVKTIDSMNQAEDEFIIHVSDNIGTGLDIPLKKLLLPSKAKRVIIEGNGNNGIITANTQINLKTDVIFSNILIAAVKKGKKGQECVPLTVEVGKHYFLLQDMLSELEDEKTGFVYKSHMKIWGTKHSVVETIYMETQEETDFLETEIIEEAVTENKEVKVLEEFVTDDEGLQVTEETAELEDVEEAVTETQDAREIVGEAINAEDTEEVEKEAVDEEDIGEIVEEAANVEDTGEVTLEDVEETVAEITETAAVAVNSRKKEKRTTMISEINNVGKVFLHTVMPREDIKSKSSYDMKYMMKDGIIGVEELTLDKGVTLDCNRKDILVKNLIMGADEGNTIHENMRSQLYAANITVYDKTIMKDSDINARSNKEKDGNIKLNQVSYLNEDNHITGKTDKKGRSLVRIKGKVSRPGDNIPVTEEQRIESESAKNTGSIFAKKEKQKKLEKVPRKKKAVERIKKEKTNKKVVFLKKKMDSEIYKGTEDKL